MDPPTSSTNNATASGHGNIHPHPTRASDVRFVKLNSFDVMSELVRPRSVNDAKRNGQVVLRLGKLSSSIRVVIRFCLWSSKREMQVDFLPKSFWLRINNKTYKIKNNHINKFFDITQFIEERDSDKLVIHVDLDRNLKQEDYFYGIYIVKKLDPEQIYQDVIKRVGKFKTTRKILKRIINAQTGDEILIMPEVKISLLCPLTKKRIVEPIRAKTCSHIQCFDAKSFIHANVGMSRWRCPYCLKDILVNDLYVDGHIRDILQLEGSDCTAVNLLIDGGWTEATNHSSVPKSTKKMASMDIECITIDDDDM